MTASQPSDIFQPGDVLNNTYRIESILGRGGTSEVYKARSEISGKVMAVKALRAEFASNEDFLVLMTREEDIRDVQHEAIVRYFDTQRMPDGVVYLVMDHVDGPGLDAKLASGGMSAGDLMTVGKRVCEGLIAAHARNIVHRDLSPDNIILRNDNPAEAVIIDFGIAKDTNPGAETIVGNEFAGKYAYAAPEQLSGQTDARSDIYSLGALLLATFRGKKPDIGKNPMEVVQKKAEPLDVEGVPEPLRSLLARMCDPDPAQRFQSASDLRAAFDDPDTLVEADPVAALLAEPDDDATVIAPVTARAKPQPERTPPAKKRSGLMPVAVGGLAVALAAGAYFGGLLDGFLGPKYPFVENYALTIEKGADTPPTAVGHVPSPEIGAAVTDALQQAGGSADLTLASGDISADWGAGVTELLASALPLEEFRLSILGDRVQLVGMADSEAEQEAVQASFDDGLPGSFRGAADISVIQRFLMQDDLRPLLNERADCGRLQLMNPPPIGYGLEDQIIVAGRFAQAATRDALQDDIAALADGRPVRIEGEVLNPSLCRIDGVLPRAAPGGFELRLGYGDRSGENLSRVYQVGDNPTIDVKLPDDVQDGYLWVSVVDVQGVVFHLLPNRTRPDNSIAALREQAQDGFVRLAYGLAEAEGRLAFTVDGSVLGKSKILVLHSPERLFTDLRPITESAESYADALTSARLEGGLVVDALDTAILTMQE